MGQEGLEKDIAYIKKGISELSSEFKDYVNSNTIVVRSLEQERAKEYTRVALLEEKQKEIVKDHNELKDNVNRFVESVNTEFENTRENMKSISEKQTNLLRFVIGSVLLGMIGIIVTIAIS